MIILFGTSSRSARFLELVIQNGLRVNLVVSSPPKPVGKKQVLTENPTVVIARKEKIPFILTLSDLKNVIPSEVEESLSPAQQERDPSTPLRFGRDDAGLILDYNKIIPNEIINLFSKGIINIHFSKLPQYRGPAPVQYTILNGDRQAWITYYLINEKVDAGQILTQTSLDLDLSETTETLYQKLIGKAASEIKLIIDDYLFDRVQPCQQESTPSYTQKLTTENCRIDWAKPPEEIERLIRAAYPEPGAWTMIRVPSSRAHSASSGQAPSKDPSPVAKERDSSTHSTTLRAGSGRNDKLYRLKILKAHLENEKLVLDQVQLEGKNPVTWKQFQEGYPSASLS